MDVVDSSLHVFNSHIEADAAIRSLSKSGLDVKKLSLIGKGYHSNGRPTGFYTAGDGIKAWGSKGAFWGGILGVLMDPLSSSCQDVLRVSKLGAGAPVWTEPSEHRHPHWMMGHKCQHQPAHGSSRYASAQST